MKKVLLLALPLALAAGIANSQTKKVILEDYTGVNCGWCPEGTVVIEGMQTSNPANFIPIAVHTGIYEPTSNPLYTAEGAVINIAVAPTGYPAGGVDRKKYASSPDPGLAMGRGYWPGAFSARAAMTAIASVSFSNMVEIGKGSGNFEGDIKIKFTAAPTSGVPLIMNVYVIEDSIAATGVETQHNYSTAIQGGASTLSPWYHNRTFRKALSGDAWGFAGVIPAAPTVGTTYTKHITFTKDATWVKKNVKLIAYVAYNGPASSDQKEILNAEEMKLSSFPPLGVGNVNQGLNFISAYPNPASVNDVIKIEYNLDASSNVNLKVFNAMGQMVAMPYSSYEVEGGHTIHWKPADQNLAAGMYILQLSSDQGGKKTMKVNVY